MKNKDFLAELSKRTQADQTQVRKQVESLLGIMADVFTEGDSLQVPDFGTFEVRKKLERVMVSPTTGQRMLVPPKFVLGFKPSGTLKDKVNSGGED